MKPILSSALLLALALPASAQLLNFVDSPDTVSLNLRVTVDSQTVFNTNQDLSTTADAVFNGQLPSGVPDLNLPFSLSILDDDRATTHQISFSVTNPAPFELPITINSLTFSVIGLFDLNPGQVLSDLNFVTGDTSLTDNFSSSYHIPTGSFTFANTSGFTFPANTTLNFTGTFVTSAIPEPASFAALFGLAAVGLAASRRRPRAAS